MKTALLGLVLATIAGGALAQDAPPRPGAGGPQGARGMMMRADTNGDGVITRGEVIAQATQRFDRMDRNRDGKLTAEEMERIGRRMGQMRGDMPPPPLPPTE